MSWHLALLAALVAMQVADALTTIAVLKRGGQELNPVVRTLMQWIGRDWALLAIKLAFIAVVVYWQSVIPTLALAALVAGMMALVAHNVRVLRGTWVV